MAKGRKTINVEEIKLILNEQLKRTDDTANYHFKSGVALALEKILLMSDNYHGFYYLNEEGLDDTYDREYY